ncbi:MAG: segregation/condensation protein A [Deltaproteobacteria bacterium]|nr:MAG: segregation/condensation protein A [Deltaproteobacteria bacterium]
MSAPAQPEWLVQTEVFDGPLDLLLYLVRREGVDLRALPVARVADAYLAYLDKMRDLHLGVAGEYLVMAATLVWLKSLELLPRKPTLHEEEEEEGEDPREALARRLREYAQYREAADELDTRPRVGRDVFVRDPTEVEGEQRPVEAGIDAFGLLDLYYELITREAEPEPEYSVDTRTLSLEEACRFVLGTLSGGRGELSALLSVLPTRRERILTFVAVLEMVRLGWVGLEQDEHLGPVQVEGKVSADVDLSRVMGRVEAATA